MLRSGYFTSPQAFVHSEGVVDVQFLDDVRSYQTPQQLELFYLLVQRGYCETDRGTP